MLFCSNRSLEARGPRRILLQGGRLQIISALAARTATVAARWSIVCTIFGTLVLAAPARAQFCPLPAVNPWCVARQPMDCQTTATNETCLPREIIFPAPGAPPDILLCDCFTDVPDCGPVDIQPNPIPPGGYTVSCPGPCPPGQACELHFSGISQGVNSIDSSQIPTGAIVSCGCVVPPPPPVCPLGNSWCVGLQSTDCNTTTIDETCLPREVIIDPLTGLPIILLCDCFTNVPGCGPVDVQPNPTTGYTVSCPGPCPIPQTCQVHFNGIPQGVGSIDSSLIPPGTGVTCACAEQGPTFCPLPANPECAALQLRDCQSPTGTCLPKAIRHHIPAVAAFFPPAGTDVLRSTTGYVIIQSPFGEIMTYYIRESPPNVTQVIRESPTDVGGHRIITTEIIAMDLVGVGGGGGGGGGGGWSAVQIRESPTLSSKGQVTGAVSGVTDYPAESFFDIFVEIDIPGLGVTGLYNDELTPIPLETHGITKVPPLGSSFKTPQGWLGVELLDASGFPTGFWIREVLHELPPPDPPEWEVILCECMDPLACHATREFSVYPTCVGDCPAGYECIQRITTIDPFTVDYLCECVPLGACCYADLSGLNSLCTQTTVSNCVNTLHGAYEGDGTVCGGTAACCLPNGGCAGADSLCCARELGGHASPIQAPACLSDPSGNGIDDACETLDHVVCEPQGGVNPTHPNVYWYDVTPQGWGRCDFHVLLVDPNPANYFAWTINPWPGNTWQFSVHQVGTETWASWYTPNCAEPMSPGTTYRLQFNHRGASAWSHWRTTYTGNNDPYDPLTFDRSQNHPGEPDGYGYRVHVPTPTAGSKWDQWPDFSLPGLHAADGTVLADNWVCEGGLVTDLHWWGNYELDLLGQERRGAGIQCINLSIHADNPATPWCLPQEPALWGVCAFFSAIKERDTGMMNSEGSKIYEYTFYLNPGWPQETGHIYWLDIEAQSINPANPAMWRWQEAGRVPVPIVCPAAQRSMPPPPFMWSSIVWAPPPLLYSEMAFRVTSNPYPPDPDPTGIKKSRFISLAAGNAGEQTALRVKLTSLHHVVPPYPLGPPTPFTLFEGQSMWVGPPVSYFESGTTGTTFMASKLQCDPYYQDWSTISLLHITGEAITPSSSYDIESLDVSCMGNEATCTAVSTPLTIVTARSGDVIINEIANFADISALVAKFQAKPGAPIKARAKMIAGDARGLISIAPNVGFGDIAVDVDAFKGKPYPYKPGKCMFNPAKACIDNADCGVINDLCILCP